ncbi:NAD(P)/FAD-dependent oxidoreductase [Pseudomonas aeruginosa]|uniref:NAD(P)/FAD-dependent oxidoreductase n=1 Tax=Pseudomonas aeruginosa TaxID=287 RepID=UPI0015D4F60B|nr:NAD(P)/FAD-dependent oxidoreductase [Pseudomonas aeruginosa]NYU38182.1 NAD(P)/FAD-dependent oxidoreductase [Pseudomonas aeruginosa]HCF1891946.1 NAD(P)/FAD-dependent oxidoreductase [Pseudomonas aeruginosa]HCF1895374.1 NAD(P)/FAD-dependent oxidoreductase [Pseudomonas aeruginosa]
MGKTKSIETIVVGAGPAGLTAALYLARYRRQVLVLHDDESRALRIPRTYNVPGYADGIVGTELIERMMEHATSYGAEIEQAEIRSAQRRDGMFLLEAADGHAWSCRALILATGLRLNQLDLPHETHEAAIQADVLRYCPVCDGYEHRDKRIGVIGCDADGAAEALFLRQYSRDITLMSLDRPELSSEQLVELDDAGITLVAGALRALSPHDDRMDVLLEGREAPLSFDVVYPALGTRPRSELATGIGADVEPGGCLPAGAPRQTDVPGLFAAGDVVEGLDQISVAIGHGAIAATCAHNWLRECDRHTLQHTG